jgi:hypothetical protein
MGRSFKNIPLIKSIKSLKEKATNQSADDSEVENFTRNRNDSPRQVGRPKSRIGKFTKSILDGENEEYKKKSDSELIATHNPIGE